MNVLCGVGVKNSSHAPYKKLKYIINALLISSYHYYLLCIHSKFKFNNCVVLSHRITTKSIFNFKIQILKSTEIFAKMNKLIIIALVSLCVVSQAAVIRNVPQFPITAQAEIEGSLVSKETNETSKLTGTVRFEQMSEHGGVFVTTKLSFDKPSNIQSVLRGIHVHTAPIAQSKHLHLLQNWFCFFVNATPIYLDKSCETAAGHWNPAGVTHGWLTSLVHHAGDLGNFRFSAEGVAQVEVRSFDLSLYGKNSIVNRSVVVHGGMDDGGLGNAPMSKTAGNAGPKIACGTIFLVDL